MKKIIISIPVILILLAAAFASAQPSLPGSSNQQGDQGIKEATNILNQYAQYFDYYKAIVSGQVGGIIYKQFFSLAMKDADPNTQATITFFQTLKGILPKNVQGRPSGQMNKQTTSQKQDEIEANE